MSEGAVVKRSEMDVFPLAGELIELIEFRENTELSEEERQACDQAIDQYVEANVRETDRVRSAIRKAEVMAQIHRDEARRAMELADSWTARAEMLQGRVKAVMERLQIKSVEGKTGKLSIVGNGGDAPIQIVQEAMVTEEHCRYEGRIAGSAWRTIRACLELLGEDLGLMEGVSMQRVVSKSSVKAELKAGGAVAGARFGERGTSLRVR